MPAHQMKAGPLRSGAEMVLFAGTLKCRDCGHDGLNYSSDDDHRGGTTIVATVKCPICRKWTEIEFERAPGYGDPTDNLRVANGERPSQILPASFFRAQGEAALQYFANAEPRNLAVRAELVVQFYVELRKFGELEGVDRENLQIGLRALLDSGETLPADIARLVER